VPSEDPPTQKADDYFFGARHSSRVPPFTLMTFLFQPTGHAPPFFTNFALGFILATAASYVGMRFLVATHCRVESLMTATAFARSAFFTMIQW